LSRSRVLLVNREVGSKAESRKINDLVNLKSRQIPSKNRLFLASVTMPSEGRNDASADEHSRRWPRYRVSNSGERSDRRASPVPESFAAFLRLTPKQNSSAASSGSALFEDGQSIICAIARRGGECRAVFIDNPYRCAAHMGKKLIEKETFQPRRRGARQQDGAHCFAILRGKTSYREIPAVQTPWRVRGRALEPEAATDVDG